MSVYRNIPHRLPCCTVYNPGQKLSVTIQKRGLCTFASLDKELASVFMVSRVSLHGQQGQSSWGNAPLGVWGALPPRR
ncbi:hypothetical protein ACOMHN_008386 [Nucella lapillus]